jgi:hypothetical protein
MKDDVTDAGTSEATLVPDKHGNYWFGSLDDPAVFPIKGIKDKKGSWMASLGTAKGAIMDSTGIKAFPTPEDAIAAVRARSRLPKRR